MKLQPQLFNQLPGIPQDQVLATPNVAEPQNMINEAMTLPEEAQANMANMVQQQAMAWADILRKGRIAEEAKLKKRASNLYRPMVAEYARELDSGERRPQPEGYAGQLHKAFSDSPISKVGTPFVGDVKTDMENWHEKTKQDIVQELGIQDDDTLIASVGEELDSLFITPKSEILRITQARYTEEAKRMASDYLSEVSLEAINNKGMTDEKVASYLQSMVEAGIFQDRDTIDLLKEYEKNVDNNQMNYDAAANPLDFVKSIEDNSWKKKYPNASPNFVMSAYGRYKPVQVAETKKEKKLREDKLKELSHMNLSQLQERRPVILINDILGGDTKAKATLISMIRNNEEPVLSEDRVKELLKNGKYPGVKAHEFSAYLNGAYGKIIKESNAQLTGQKQKTREQFLEFSKRFKEKGNVNENWGIVWTQLNGIGDGPGWWDDVAFDEMGFETERRDLHSIWKWLQKKNDLMQKVSSREISQPEMINLLKELAPEKGIESGDETDAIGWKSAAYESTRKYLEQNFLDPSNVSEKKSDFASMALSLTNDNWDGKSPVPVKKIMEGQKKWKQLEDPTDPADVYKLGYRVVPKPLIETLDRAFISAKNSESAGQLLDEFFDMIRSYYPDKYNYQLALREYAAESDEYSPEYNIFTDPVVSTQGNVMPSVYVDRTLRSLNASQKDLTNQIEDKYPSDGADFVEELTKEGGEIGKVFYGQFGFGNATVFRHSSKSIEPFRSLTQRYAMQLKLEFPELDAEEAAQMAHEQLYDSRFLIYPNPENPNQILFMSHTEFQQGYHGVPDPEDASKGEQLAMAGIAPQFLMTLAGVEEQFAKQKTEAPIELAGKDTKGYINRNVSNLMKEVMRKFNVKEEALRRNPNIKILPVPNSDNSGRTYKLIHPETDVWVWMTDIDGNKWEVPNSAIADLTFQTHIRALYYKLPDYLDAEKSWSQSAFEKWNKIKPDYLPDVDTSVGSKFFEMRNPIELLEEIANTPGYFNTTPDLDVAVTEWPMDYRAFNVAPDFVWMIGGIERAHLKDQFIPQLKSRYGKNPSIEEIQEFAKEKTAFYADLTGKWYLDHVWRFWGFEPLKPEHYKLPESLEYRRGIESQMLKEQEESKIPPSDIFEDQVLEGMIPAKS